jgi:biopolymer transport protein ExbD
MRLLGRTIKCPGCDEPIELPSQSEINDQRAAARQAKAERVAADTEWSNLEKSVAVPTPLAAPRSKSPPVRVDDEPEIETLDFKKRENVEDDMDMTPMVDVTFLLLIFFMITANFTMQKAIQVPAQRDDQASSNSVPEPDKVDDSVTVQIDEFNGYTVLLPDGSEQQVSSKQSLITTLAIARASDAGSPDGVTKLIVDAHQDSLYKTAVDALDAGRDKGFSSLQYNVVEEFQ